MKSLVHIASLCLLLGMTSCKQAIVNFAIHEVRNFHVEGDNERRFERAAKSYPDMTPISVQQLSDMLQADSTHYKVLIFVNSCSGIAWMGRHLYGRYWNSIDTTRVKTYLVCTTSDLKYYKKHAEDWNIHPDAYYYLHDTNPELRSYWKFLFWKMFDYDRHKVISTLYPNGNNVEAVYDPMTCISDKQNRLWIVHQMPYGENAPTTLYDALGKNLDEIDFGRIDTVTIDNEYTERLQAIDEWLTDSIIRLN